MKPSRLIFAALGLLVFLCAVYASLPQTPSLILSAPATAYVNEAILVDARRSTISKVPLADGAPSFTVDYGDGFSANLLATGHAYGKPGTYTITLTAGSSSTTKTIVVSEIPAGTIVRMIDAGDPVRSGQNLQAEINLAESTQEFRTILLPDGFKALGPIVLSAGAAKYVRISAANLLPPRSRDSKMPIVMTPASSNNTVAAMWTTNPAPANPPGHYLIQGIHFKKDDETKHSQTLVSIGDVNQGQNKISMLPSSFIIDRCWFDGGASDTSQTTNGLRIAANAVTVVDSYLGDFRLIGGGVDAAAISLSKGQGPYAFINNTMVATSENFNIAGGPAERNTAVISNATRTTCSLSSIANLELDQNIALPIGGVYRSEQSTIVRAINGNQIAYDPIDAPDNGGTAEWVVTPSYVEFRRNYLYKPLKWRRGDPSFNGIDYQLKNLFETKFSRYLVADGNVMQNQWMSSQAYAITLTVRNNTGGESPAAVVRDLQFSNNIIKNVANGVSILPSDYFGPTQLTSDITFRNNLFQNVGPNWDGNGNMLINLLGGQRPTDQSKRIYLINNTHDNPTNQGTITDFGASGTGSGATESLWLNNVFSHGAYGLRSNNTNQDQPKNINEFLPGGFGRNLIINPQNFAWYLPTTVIATGPQFVDAVNGDFTLIAGSPGKAVGGKDLGVDMAALRKATSGAVSGIWDVSPTSSPTPSPSPSATPAPTPVPSPTPLTADFPWPSTLAAQKALRETARQNGWRCSMPPYNGRLWCERP